MTTRSKSPRKVAGVHAPPPRLTGFALSLVAGVLSLLVAVPLWLFEWLR